MILLKVCKVILKRERIVSGTEKGLLEEEEGEGGGEWRVRRDKEGRRERGGMEREESREKIRGNVCWCILILRCTSKRHTPEKFCW